MTAVAHLVCWDAFRGRELGVAERLTVWGLARAGRVGHTIMAEDASGNLHVLWHGCTLLPCLDFAHGLDLVMDLS